MNRLLFRQRLNHLREDTLRFQNTLCAYETTDAVRYPENFEKLGLDMVRQAESIACGTRNIVSIFQMNGREQVQSCAAEAQGITVKEQPYGYEVILPHLMPKRNYRNHTVFLLEPLTYALKEFTAVHPICRLEYALIWFMSIQKIRPSIASEITIISRRRKYWILLTAFFFWMMAAHFVNCTTAQDAETELVPE